MCTEVAQYNINKQQIYKTYTSLKMSHNRLNASCTFVFKYDVCTYKYDVYLFTFYMDTKQSVVILLDILYSKQNHNNLKQK